MLFAGRNPNGVFERGRDMINWMRRLRRDRRGNVAMILGLCAMPLAIVAGASVDLMRQHAARQEAQDTVDQAALAAAISRSRTQADLAETVESFLQANLTGKHLESGYAVDVVYDPQRHHIQVNLESGINAFFSGLIGRDTLPIRVTSTAVRGAAEAVELVLVLDNTDSMNQIDSGGQTRIAALKAAAAELVNTVKENEIADVKVGIVPYAEYVNVGKDKLGQPWIDVTERDEYKPATPSPGDYDKNLKRCAAYGPYYSKTQVEQRDGYSVTKTVQTRDCIEWEKDPRAGTPRPGSPASTVKWRFEGCVYSRVGDLRLTDAPPTPYPGILENNGRKACMTPILPLTATKATVLSSINGMTTTISGKVPQTYIPSGLLWGINVLSPSAPFSEGRAYASGNRSPRKIMVLMTDGENTMRYRQDAKKTYGYHETTSAAGQIKQTNDDVAALCAYAKAQEIEVYTVALGVGNGAAQDMLRTCATKSDWFFNAANNAALGAAFRDIAASINRVRLIR